MLEHVPREVTVTVTTSPRKGLEPTLELVEQIAAGGYDVVPHLAARHVRDGGHLAELVERRMEATDVLVMAGDAEVPAGVFDGALPLLEALAELGTLSKGGNHGLPGEPVPLGRRSDESAARKSGVRDVHRDSDLLRPGRDGRLDGHRREAFGCPSTSASGPCRDRGCCVCERIGVGDSLRSLSTRVGEPRRGARGDFDPDPLVLGLDTSLDGRRPNMAGFHIFTFNDLEGTERWRQERLARLTESGRG